MPPPPAAQESKLKKSIAFMDTIRIDFDTKAENIQSALDVKLQKGLKLKTKFNNNVGIVAADLTDKNWKLSYDFQKKDLTGKIEKKFDAFDLKISQVVPNLKWSIIPSPEIEIETKIINKDRISDSLELKYDTRQKKASIEEKFTFDKKHDLSFESNTATGLDGTSVTWKTKLDQKYIKMVSAKYSKDKGAILSTGLAPSKLLDVKLDAALQPQTLKGEIKYKPEQAENAEIGMTFSKPFKGNAKQNVNIFVKWKF